VAVEWAIKPGNSESMNLAVLGKMLSLGTGARTAEITVRMEGYEEITISRNTAEADC